MASLKSGRYTDRVDDKAAKTAFKVQRIKKSPVTVTGVGIRRQAHRDRDARRRPVVVLLGRDKKSYFVIVV